MYKIQSLWATKMYHKCIIFKSKSSIEVMNGKATPLTCVLLDSQYKKKSQKNLKETYNK